MIGWVKEAIILAISRQLGIGWKGIASIIRRAVMRGLARRKEQVVANICVDEVSYRKGHKYLTIVSNADTGTVLYVGRSYSRTVLVGLRYLSTYLPINQIRTVLCKTTSNHSLLRLWLGWMCTKRRLHRVSTIRRQVRSWMSGNCLTIFRGYQNIFGKYKIIMAHSVPAMRRHPVALDY
ncbi:MAG: hypothetical protein OXE92_00125 [Bacteroidetes bacterium]|nr:hypothetical protein [Bacteroidota bacterium]